MSTACWVIPQEPVDRLKELRSLFLSWMRDWESSLVLGLWYKRARINACFRQGSNNCFRRLWSSFCKHVVFHAVPPHQPFLLDAWQALSLATADVDAELPQLLKGGVPTGIIKPIAPSKVWDKADDCDFELDQALQVHTSPWKSARENLQLARSLMMQDVEAGFAYILAGGIEEAKRKWGAHVAVGRLGLAEARSHGDASIISGANHACRVPEKVRLPGLHRVQRALSGSSPSWAWVALSFDVASAHKLVRVRPEEQGVGCFALGDELFVYRSCFFGAKNSAYWFSRVGAWLVRMIHQFVYIPHACLLYVDSGLLLHVAPSQGSGALGGLSMP